MKTRTTRFVSTAASSGALALLMILHSLVHAQTCAAGFRASNPSSVYVIDAANGTVTDTRTGLMWDQCPRGLSGAACTVGTEGAFNWQQALDSATTANSGSHKGYTDWRLPNVKELRSLVEECRANPSINEWAFPSTPGLFFWSGSPVADGVIFTWAVAFNSGRPFMGGRSITSGRVRLVRAGQ
jgi:Protein of unknown function (DUF1566)